MTHSYNWWRAALAGKQPQIHEDQPQPGYFRVRRKGEPWEPVAIWPDNDGSLVAIRSGRPVSAQEIWTWAARHPVAHKVYTDAVAGKGWPEDIDAEVEAVKAASPGLHGPTPGATYDKTGALVQEGATNDVYVIPQVPEATVGHNSGREHEMALDEIATLDRAFEAWLKEIGGSITTEEQNAKTETWQDRYAKLAKKAKEEHERLKRPILEAGRAVDEAWKPVQAKAKAGKDAVGAAALAFRVKREQERKAAEAKRQEEERIAREAARKAAEEAVERGEDPPPPPPAPVQSAPRYQKTGLRTVSVTQVTDLRAAVSAILDADPNQPDLLDVVRTIATRMIKAGNPVAGAQIVQEQRA